MFGVTHSNTLYEDLRRSRGICPICKSNITTNDLRVRSPVNGVYAHHTCYKKAHMHHCRESGCTTSWLSRIHHEYWPTDWALDEPYGHPDLEMCSTCLQQYPHDPLTLIPPDSTYMMDPYLIFKM